MNYKFGDLFKEITGKKPQDFKSLLEIEKEVEQTKGIKLKTKAFASNLVHPRGNVFPITTDERDIDNEIDIQLKKMKRFLKKFSHPG